MNRFASRALLVAGTGAVVMVPAAFAVADETVSDLPLEMSNFSVAVGQVDADSRENWQRLGTYQFDDDGTVTEQHWHWTQRNRVTRDYTGVTPGDCGVRECDIQTADGFGSAGAPQELEGTFEVGGDGALRIEWSDNGWEEWTVSEAAEGELAELTFVDSSFGATHGLGYGSNAALDERASAEQIAEADHTGFEHEFYLWKTDEGTPYVDEGRGGEFWVTDWNVCAESTCLGAATSTPTHYYVSSPNPDTVDRRDTLWHWRTQLADDRGEHCYTGNSHVKPMLQVLDSRGEFFGWVGVEASLSQTSSGTDADDVGIFKIAVL